MFSAELNNRVLHLFPFHRKKRIPAVGGEVKEKREMKIPVQVVAECYQTTTAPAAVVGFDSRGNQPDRIAGCGFLI